MVLCGGDRVHVLGVYWDGGVLWHVVDRLHCTMKWGLLCSAS